MIGANGLITSAATKLILYSPPYRLVHQNLGFQRRRRQRRLRSAPEWRRGKLDATDHGYVLGIFTR